MEETFFRAYAFNSELAWDTSSVTTMTNTFNDAYAFNQPLVWDTSKVTHMITTFNGANGETAFNQPGISAWDVSKASRMDRS